jgi:hypothetical protein
MTGRDSGVAIRAYELFYDATQCETTKPRSRETPHVRGAFWKKRVVRLRALKMCLMTL